MRFELSSAICFSLDQSKILSSGNGLNTFAISFDPGQPVHSVQADLCQTFLLLGKFSVCLSMIPSQNSGVCDLFS